MPLAKCHPIKKEHSVLIANSVHYINSITYYIEKTIKPLPIISLYRQQRRWGAQNWSATNTLWVQPQPPAPVDKFGAISFLIRKLKNRYFLRQAIFYLGLQIVAVWDGIISLSQAPKPISKYSIAGILQPIFLLRLTILNFALSSTNISTMR